MSAWRNLFFLTLFCLFSGFIFLLIQRKWIIIQLPFGNCSIIGAENLPIAEKIVSNVHFNCAGEWQRQEVFLICSSQDKPAKLRQLVKNWLIIMQEKQLIPAHIIVESAVISSTGADAYLSFDRNIFMPQMSILEKWMVIESLLRTLVDASLSLQAVQLFVHHKPMHDEHIELSQPLAVQQFITD